MSITKESLLLDLLESEAYANYYLQWENEERAEKPAFNIFHKYSLIGAKDGKWTLRMAMLDASTFSSFRKAEEHLITTFLKNKATKESGKLWRHMRQKDDYKWAKKEEWKVVAER